LGDNLIVPFRKCFAKMSKKQEFKRALLQKNCRWRGGGRLPQVGRTKVIVLERMLKIQEYIAQSNEIYLLVFAKCIVQSPPNSPGKLFTAQHTLLKLVTGKLCLSVRRRKHVVTKFTPNKTLLINDIVRKKNNSRPAI